MFDERDAGGDHWEHIDFVRALNAATAMAVAKMRAPE